MKKMLLGLVTGCVFIFIVSFQGIAYIPTSTQILKDLLKINKNLKSLEETFKTTIYDDQFKNGKIIIDEKILIKRGGFIRSERNFVYGNDFFIKNERTSFVIMEDEACADIRIIETIFPTIFSQKTADDLINNLCLLGIDTETVAFDRVNKRITYITGSRKDNIPTSKLRIDKATGLPLEFIGSVISMGKEIILRAEYKDYKFINKCFWLPQTLEYYKNDVLWVVSKPKDILLNELISEHFFHTPRNSNIVRMLSNFLDFKE